MVTWIPSIYPSHVSIYTSTMDPMGYETTWMDTFVFFQLKCWEITSRDGNQERRSLSGDQCTALHLKDFHLEPYLTASLNLWYILQRHANTLSNIYIYLHPGWVVVFLPLLEFLLFWLGAVSWNSAALFGNSCVGANLELPIPSNPTRKSTTNPHSTHEVLLISWLGLPWSAAAAHAPYSWWWGMHVLTLIAVQGCDTWMMLAADLFEKTFVPFLAAALCAGKVVVPL